MLLQILTILHIFFVITNLVNTTQINERKMIDIEGNKTKTANTNQKEDVIEICVISYDFNEKSFDNLSKEIKEFLNLYFTVTKNRIVYRECYVDGNCIDNFEDEYENCDVPEAQSVKRKRNGRFEYNRRSQTEKTGTQVPLKKRFSIPSYTKVPNPNFKETSKYRFDQTCNNSSTEYSSDSSLKESDNSSFKESDNSSSEQSDNSSLNDSCSEQSDNSNLNDSCSENKSNTDEVTIKNKNVFKHNFGNIFVSFEELMKQLSADNFFLLQDTDFYKDQVTITIKMNVLNEITYKITKRNACLLFDNVPIMGHYDIKVKNIQNEAHQHHRTIKLDFDDVNNTKDSSNAKFYILQRRIDILTCEESDFTHKNINNLALLIENTMKCSKNNEKLLKKFVQKIKIKENNSKKCYVAFSLKFKNDQYKTWKKNKPRKIFRTESNQKKVEK